MKKAAWLIGVAATLGSAAAFAIPEGPAYPSAEWTAREAQNFAKVVEAPAEQLTNPEFLTRLTTQSLINLGSLTARDLADPSWLLASSTPLNTLLAGLLDPAALSTTLQQALNQAVANPGAAVSLSLDSPLTPPCASYGLICDGDPFRFPEAAGPDGNSFFSNEAVVAPVVFYDSSCARLTGQVWRPKNVAQGQTLPGVVIQNGSIEAPQTAYWWAAQLLVRNGYVVLTFDPRGQGRSDEQTPRGQQGGNIEPSIFWTGLVDAIDFFRSSPATPYPNNLACASAYPTKTTAFNPYYSAIDAERLGIAGHSLGAIAVSVVQGYGAPGADPWPGKIDKTNPVKAGVTWDGLLPPGGLNNAGGTADGGLLYMLRQLPITAPIIELIFERGLPNFAPRVPVLSADSDYGLAPTPYLSPPDPDEHRDVEQVWAQAGVPAFDFTIQGSTHYEFSLVPTFPATSWCPDTSSGACAGGWGQPMIQHYSLAWMDRWLKKPGESGYDDADARLLDDGGAQGSSKMSFYFRSSRSFPDRSGTAQVCEDIRAGCTGETVADHNSGGAFSPWMLLCFTLLGWRRLKIPSTGASNEQARQKSPGL